jgi:MSHA biogenesis protein MshO
MSRQATQAGFSLVEMIMVVVITGILGAIVAVFIQRPVTSYVASSNRAALSDVADLSLRRIQRDVRRALPNSVRTTVSGAASAYLELVPTLAAGRYENSTAANCFTTTKCSSLVVLGTLIANAHEHAGKKLVVFNASNNFPGGCAANSVYCGNDLVTIADSVAASGSPPKGSFTFSPAVQINATGATAAHRFQIVEGPVSYECNPTTKQLLKHWGYGFQASQPTGFSSGSTALLADNIDCSFTYQVGSLQHSILGMSVTLRTSDGSESVSLYHEVAVNNVP